MQTMRKDDIYHPLTGELLGAATYPASDSAASEAAKAAVLAQAGITIEQYDQMRQSMVSEDAG